MTTALPLGGALTRLSVKLTTACSICSRMSAVVMAETREFTWRFVEKLLNRGDFNFCTRF